MEVCPPQVDRKLWNRFYEPLVLLSAYGKSQGKGFKSDREWRFGAPDHGHGALCMKFLDELAYICDYAPGGDTVAAIAIEDGCGPTYWVSANKNQAAKVKPFLNGVLSLLASAHGKGKLHDGKLEQQVTNQIISFSARRLRHYRHMLQKAVQACLSDLGMESAKEEDKSEENSLKTWLLPFADRTPDPMPDPNLVTFCRSCYAARSSPRFNTITYKAKGVDIADNDAGSGVHYARVRHFLGRMGSHVKSTSVLLEAGRTYPKLFMDYTVEFAMPSLSFTPPAYRGKSSINGIINRMVQNPAMCNFYQKELSCKDEKFHLQLQKRIRDEYQDPKFKLRTHAEINVLDLFHQKRLRFLDGIQYIGISKPACFLCYRYFLAHPLRVQISGGSNNLYLQWQPPYIRTQSPPTLVKEQEHIMNGMIKEIRTFVLENIVPSYRGLEPHPDSTTGLDTSVYRDGIIKEVVVVASGKVKKGSVELSLNADADKDLIDHRQGTLRLHLPGLSAQQTKESSRESEGLVDVDDDDDKEDRNDKGKVFNGRDHGDDGDDDDDGGDDTADDTADDTDDDGGVSLL